jgi:hypothetical protein
MKIIDNPTQTASIIFYCMGIRRSKQSKFQLAPVFSVPRPPTRVLATARIFRSVAFASAPTPAPALAYWLSYAAPVRFPALRRCPIRSVRGAVDGGVGARGVDSLPSAPRLCSTGGWRLSFHYTPDCYNNHDCQTSLILHADDFFRPRLVRKS